MMACCYTCGKHGLYIYSSPMITNAELKILNETSQGTSTQVDYQAYVNLLIVLGQVISIYYKTYMLLTYIVTTINSHNSEYGCRDTYRAC